MRIIVVAVLLAGAVAAVALLFRSLPAAAERGATSGEAAQATAELRAQLLHGTASQFAIPPVAAVWGVLMETAHPEGATTLVALDDGSASLYFSSGGGVIGGGQHPSINAAARRLVEIAGRHVSELSATSEFPLPGRGEVKFYALTNNGVLQGSAREETLGEGSHSLSEMFFAGHDVITGLREITQERND